MVRILSLVPAAALIIFMAWQPVHAADDPSAQIFLELMSPYCPGRSLQDCPSTKAAELKQEIRDMVASGSSKQEIVDQMKTRFGDEILAMPPIVGFGIMAWLLPIVFFGLGLVIFIFWLRRELRTAAQKAN